MNDAPWFDLAGSGAKVFKLCPQGRIECPKCGGKFYNRTLTFGHSVERCPHHWRPGGRYVTCGAYVFMLHVPVVGNGSMVLTVALSDTRAKDRLLALLDQRETQAQEQDHGGEVREVP